MYLSRFSVRNVRSISSAEMVFPPGSEAGWHVVLGSNGAGKSSLVRAFALLMMGEKEAYAARQDFGRWVRSGQVRSEVFAELVRKVADVVFPSRLWLDKLNKHPRIKLTLETSTEGTKLSFQQDGDKFFPWDNQPQGWFSASFGPFRRFTGGDHIYDRLFVTNKRLAAHLTALGEDVALTDAMTWLVSLFSQGLQDERNGTASKSMTTYETVVQFLNESQFLPHGAKISGVSGNAVMVIDGNGFEITLDQLSDGYRSAMSIVFELIRQMFEIYGVEFMRQAMSRTPGTIQAPGVVAIDEVDAHLHPTWQRDIGRWLTKYFPLVQFIVTTHSPIVCRAVAREDGSLAGSVWRLPAPGSGEEFRKIEGDELNQLVFGDVLDAYATELFGADVIRSAAGNHKLERLAELNTRALERELTGEEQAERRVLRKIFPAAAGSLQS